MNLPHSVGRKRQPWLQRKARVRADRSFAPFEPRARLEELESRYVLAAPTLAPIANVTVQAGAPLHIALNAFDADGDALTFSASSLSPNVTATVPTGNRSLKMDVAGFGEMRFQLFEDLAPRATSRVIALTNSGFYNGLTFHRTIPDFIIQTGDPTGTGSGGSTLGRFDDQFDLALQHTSTGVLGMAKSADDTNDSQFYIAEGAQRQLDFQHTIFGFQTTGQAVREAISNVPTSGVLNKPLSPVTIIGASIVLDQNNGVLRISAPAGTIETATIVVQVSDGHGGQAQQVFLVNIVPDGANGNPYLGDILPAITTPNTPVTFTLPAIDAEGDPFRFFRADHLQQFFGIASPAPLSPDLLYFVDYFSGQVTVVPTNNVMGDFSIFVGVAANEFAGAVDTQVVKVSVYPDEPGIFLDPASDTGVSSSDGITNRNNSNGKGFNLLVSGLTVGAVVQLFADGNSIGQGVATATGMTFATNQFLRLADGSYVVRATQTLAGVTTLLPSELHIVVDTLAPLFVSTPPTQATAGALLRYDTASSEEGASGHIYSLSLAPSGMSIDALTGVVTWIPAIDQEGLVPVVIRSTDRSGNAAEQSFNIAVADFGLPRVVGRYLFYNNSKFDAYTAALGPADDGALAIDKAVLLPGGAATQANYSNYSRGINGLAIDIKGLTNALTASDFIFRVGNDDLPALWSASAAPLNVTTRFGAGAGGAARVEIGWADGAIKNTWLQVTIQANEQTGLIHQDVFYIGNAVGESGNSTNEAAVNAADEIDARLHGRTFANPAEVDLPYDFNRDGFVNATDQIIARSNSTSLATSLKLIHPPTVPVTLDPLADVTLLAGAPLQIPLTGFGDDPGVLLFNITSTHPAIVGATNQANRSLKLAVSHAGAAPADIFSGEMVFELYEDHAPQTTARIIELAQSGYYNGLTFHRVIDNFVIQGGDPLGDGTGGSGFKFDDEYSPDLQYTSTGILGMAKAYDDSNDSQFFITELPQRRLDFNHTIFGRLTAGENIREAISNVPVAGSNKPLAAVTIDSAAVFFDPQRRVLLLQAPIGATGSGDVTVTVSNAYGGQAQRTFHVTLAADTTDNRPILGSMAPILVPNTGIANFQLTALDLEGDPVYFEKVTPAASLKLTLDTATGAGTLQAQNGFYGVHSIYVGVRPPFNDGTGIDQYDAQEIPVLVAPPTPLALDLLSTSDTGISNSDNITTRNNLGVAQKLQFMLSGLVTGAEVTLYADGTPIGSAIASDSTVVVTTNGAFELTLGPHSFTARQTLKNQSLVGFGNQDGAVDIPSALTMALSVTITADPLLAIAMPLADVDRQGALADAVAATLPLESHAELQRQEPVSDRNLSLAVDFCFDLLRRASATRNSAYRERAASAGRYDLWTFLAEDSLPDNG